MFTLYLNTASNCKSVSVGLSMVTGDKSRLVTPPTFPSVKVDAIYNSVQKRLIENGIRFTKLEYSIYS